MRHISFAILVVTLGISGSLVDMDAASAQSRSLPKGSSLAATPPVNQRGKQFRALSVAQRRAYVRQGYRGPGWQDYQ